MQTDDDKWIQSDDGVTSRGSVIAAEIEREAVLLEVLEGCSKAWAVMHAHRKAGSRTLRSHDSVIALS